MTALSFTFNSLNYSQFHIYAIQTFPNQKEYDSRGGCDRALSYV